MAHIRRANGAILRYNKSIRREILRNYIMKNAPPRVHFYPVLKVGSPLACGLGQGRLRAAQAWRSLQPSLRWPQFSLTFPPRFSPPLSLCEFLTARVSPTAFLHPRVRRAFHPLPFSVPAFAARFTHCLSPLHAPSKHSRRFCEICRLHLVFSGRIC